MLSIYTLDGFCLPREMRVIGIRGIPLVQPADNLAELIVNAAGKRRLAFQKGDILVVAQKIVSKAEGRIIKSDDVIVSERAREIAEKNGFNPVHVELALREASSVIREERVLITETKGGQVCNFSGVDRSNTEAGSFILLPENPDLSAQRIRNQIRSILEIDLGVVVSDTQGRPWRRGSVAVAIGVAGLDAFKHNRGKRDLFDRTLKGSTVCQADEIACAAEPVMGQGAEGVPAAIVRGYRYSQGEGGAKLIVRPIDEDLFR
ncbi:coenzyme F420-0:L-glutamate ligase [Candidatus Thorarchaeota archaeon]|nr:MAG: coenzyme F420-0:L-glutamate ligase [Candidatus Thorarchaeota archaeon]